MALIRKSLATAYAYVAARRVLAGVLLGCLLLGIILGGPVAWVSARGLDLKAAERLDAESAIRSSLLQLLGGVFLLVGLVFTARSVRLTREGHITDRYASAIEQLGHESTDVRLGGIFALERIARDSDADRETVVEVLTAYVRTHTTSAPRVPKDTRIDVDVQAALTVLGRRPKAEAESHMLDLTHCGLVGARLSGNFDRANFGYSLLNDAILTGGSFVGAAFTCAKAKTVGFNHANARGAHFVRASFVNSWFINSDLTGADFYGCDLTQTDMGLRYPESGAPADASRLDGADLTDATLTEAHLGGLDLRTVRGLTPEQLAAADADENTITPLTWEEPDARGGDGRN